MQRWSTELVTEMAKKVGAQVFVSRLSAYITNGELAKLFSRFGEVKDAHLILDQRTRRPKGFGFVTFGSEDEAQKAIKGLDGRIVAGRLIFVEPANTAPPKPDNPRSD
uniref:RRM domain-containing protein n=1 Tax=Kalanchoe fedtschenkoi TaxID=63787 RepID=A0A7N0UCN7_KALFE